MMMMVVMEAPDLATCWPLADWIISQHKIDPAVYSKYSYIGA